MPHVQHHDSMDFFWQDFTTIVLTAAHAASTAIPIQSKAEAIGTCKEPACSREASLAAAYSHHDRATSHQ